MDRQEIFRLGKMKKYDAGSGPKGRVEAGRRSADCEDSIEVSVSSLDSDTYSLRFTHRGCLLSRASMNALIESIGEKPRAEARRILEDYRRMVRGQSFSNLPERLLLFRKFLRFPSRIPCLLLGCDQILKSMGEE